MKKKLVQILIFFLAFIIITSAQTFDGEWTTEYVTSDNPDSANSTGLNVIAVTAIDEDSFVALINNESANSFYLVGYRGAGMNTGRLGNFPYNPDDLQTLWIDFFTQEFVFDANDLASKGNLIYVANNEEGSNSVLVFELKEDSIYTYPQRYSFGEYIWGIDIDDAGRIYVTKTQKDGAEHQGSVVVLDNPDNSPAWTTAGTSKKILQEFTVPDVGQLRGITVNGDGTIIYVSNFHQNKVYCFIGDPINGYELYNGFNFDVGGEFISSGSETLTLGPYGLKLMPEKNLLFVSHDANFGVTDRYEYAKIFIANPNTGEILDTIDVAEWNFSVHNSYTDRVTGIASGFASTYDVDFDQNFNVYSQSYNGWTVEKWLYSSELPTVELTITSVEVLNETIPNEVSLSQNYPNPFNPSTTIEFRLNKDQQIDLAIYNLNGEFVTKLVNSARLSAGSYKVTFDASNLASGNYFYKLSAGEQVLTNKMTLIK